MRRLVWSTGVVLMVLLGAIGLVLAVVWISIATHPDPGNLTMNVFFVSAGWAVLMTIAFALFWANRDSGTAGGAGGVV